MQLNDLLVPCAGWSSLTTGAVGGLSWGEAKASLWGLQPGRQGSTKQGLHLKGTA